ncbi:hypothetical protein [Xylocopilactobacillus apicola]|uniref:DUF2974 domain-containing protein n=1 Tax=Xylocopilactobacillus apicola TaxID=2932184 RepID=A0AAU9CZI6_9LACO|nr:hypothetical protein [Xylocopilactobacillus apicola]BDR59437.1 hypothetical protein XA3_18780 [Xylocopilactobacillus apicola]
MKSDKNTKNQINKNLEDWSKYTDKQRMQFAQQEYKDYKVGEEVKLEKGRTSLAGFVVDKVDNKKTGEQSYVVANSPMGTKPTDVKEIAVLYQGSKEPGNKGWKEDWIHNNVNIGIQKIGGKVMKTAISTAAIITSPSFIKVAAATELSKNIIPTGPTPQLKSSAETLQMALKKYPNAKVTVYGHSLGSMDGQFALASVSEKQLKRIKGGYLYQGPNVFFTLNANQKDIASKLGKRNVHNYVDVRDLVTMKYFERKEGVIGRLELVDSLEAPEPEDGGPIKKKLKKYTNQHMWGGYQFRKDGSLKLADPLDGIVYLFNDLSKNLGLVGSGNSKEKMLLQYPGLISYAEKMSTIMEGEMRDIVKICRAAISECDRTYNNGLNSARSIGRKLSESEILSALDSGGCTRASIVTYPSEKYEKKIDSSQQMIKKFESLSKKLKQSGEKISSADRKVAGIF